MGDSSARFVSDFEFSRAIVWDALTDADLVSGWWGEAVVAGELGGEFSLSHGTARGSAAVRGMITDLRPLDALGIAFDDGSGVAFELEELPVGNRGTSTRLHVVVTGIAAENMAVARADWLTAFDQLDDLLRGHPVDWAHWVSDRGATWSRHLAEVGDSTA